MTNALTITPTTRCARAEGLVASEIDGEAVILSIDSGSFFNLNPMGTRIWDMVETPATIADICAALQQRFAVSADECRNDVTGFIANMIDQGLLEVA